MSPTRRHIARARRFQREWLSVNLLATHLEQMAGLVQPRRMLDIGCGNRPYQAWFSSATSYIGVDVTAKDSLPDAIARADVALPFAAGSFDTVLCTQVLEHTAEPGTLLREVGRVLIPGGALILSAPMYWPHHEEPYDYYRYTRFGLAYLLERAGLRVSHLLQQGGAWRVAGQSLALAIDYAAPFRTYGLKAALLATVNTVAAVLDRVIPLPNDTINFVVLAHKETVTS